MRLGVLLPHRAVVLESARRPPVEACWEVARRCDASGMDIWVGDSIVAKPRLEPLTTHAYCAAITTRARLGTAVLLPALRSAGHEVSRLVRRPPAQPDEIEWRPDSAEIDRTALEGADAVVIATRPEIGEATMRECVELGIKQVWMHRSYGQGSLIRSQLDPNSLKELTASLPTVVSGLKSGKVSPVKALWHKKLPDQNQVRRIYKEIESKDERLELNLYIVGESGEDEEGAMAEGSQES